MSRARACVCPCREAAAKRPKTVGGAAAAADDETVDGWTVGELVSAHNVQAVLGRAWDETKGGGDEPGSPATTKSATKPKEAPKSAYRKQKRAKATGKNKLAKKIGAFFGSSHGDDNANEVEPDNDEDDDEGATLPDPADRAAFNEYTDMITSRECIAVVARRAELYQAVAHLEVRPSSLALVNAAGGGRSSCCAERFDERPGTGLHGRARVC